MKKKILPHNRVFVIFSSSPDISSVKRHLVRISLRVVVLKGRAGVENPIPSSCFSKSVSKSVAEFSELFSKDCRSSFSFSAETKDIVCV